MCAHLSADRERLLDLDLAMLAGNPGECASGASSVAAHALGAFHALGCISVAGRGSGHVGLACGGFACSRGLTALPSCGPSEAV